MATIHHPNQQRHPDLGFIAIVALIALITCWLLLMPIMPAITIATIHRFHLRTPSFLQWAIQQPIPAMYNMANRAELTRTGPDGDQRLIRSETINHFPVRVVTFADGRYDCFQTGRAYHLSVTSAYRGQQQTTEFEITPDHDGKFIMSRMIDAKMIPGENVR